MFGRTFTAAGAALPGSPLRSRSATSLAASIRQRRGRLLGSIGSVPLPDLRPKADRG